MMTGKSGFKHKKLMLSVSSALAISMASHALAAEPEEGLQLNISSKSADVALMELSRVSGVQIVVPSSISQSKVLPSISGSFTIEAALDAMLVGSGLTYEFLSDDSVVIKAAEPEGQNGSGEDSDVDEEIIVTGSRISRNTASGKTVTPVTVITGNDLQRQGFNTVSDALRSVSSVTGQTEFNNFNTSLAPTAKPINLRGFGPGRTLVLINGQRIASYPIPAGGGNFANTAQIPTSAVDRIEILSGGASAIYGSDAIAGVINILTKENLDKTTVSLRSSGTQDGGAQNNRFQITGGVGEGDWNLTYGLEYNDNSELETIDRPWSDRYTDAPDVARTAFDRSRQIVNGDIAMFFPDSIAIPDAASCAALGLAFIPSTFDLNTGAGNGPSCAVSVDAATLGQLLPESESYSAFAGVRYSLTDDLELKVRVSHWDSETQFDGGFLQARPRVDFGFGVFSVGFRNFVGSETGNTATSFDEQTTDISAQLSGTWNDFYYDVNFIHSSADFESRRPVFLSTFGVELGADFLGSYTPESLAPFLAETVRVGESESNSLNVIVRGDMFDMPAGAAKFAAVAEYTRETIEDGLDARSIAGEFSGVGGTSPQSGKRGHFALGVEAVLPLTDSLTLPIAVRYDKYNDITNVDDAFTHSAGLEYRPSDNVLFRVLASTSFRAPDMEAVYRSTTVSRFFFRNYAACHGAGVASYDECVTNGVVFPNFPVDVQSGGNPSLEEEEGKSYNIGVVYDIGDNINVSLDYYRISLEGILAPAGSDAAYRMATSCQIGSDPAGNPVDSSSALCQAVSRPFTFNDTTNSLVGSGMGVAIIDSSFNSAIREQDGIDLKLNGQLEYGDSILSLAFGYTHILKTRFQELPGAEIERNFRDNENNGELRSRATLSTTWQQGPWSTTLYGQRLGSAPRQNVSFANADRGRLDPWTSWTLSGDYAFNDSLSLSLTVNNLFDKEPPFDETAISVPYRNVSLYSALGRQYMVDISYKF